MTEVEWEQVRQALATYQQKNDADHETMKATLNVLAARDAAIEGHLQVLNGSVTKAVSDIGKVTADVGKLQLWRAKLEGMVTGSRLTLILLGLLVGLLGGTGAGLVLK